TGDLVHNRPLRILHDAVAQHPERTFITVRIALDPLTAAHAQPIALAWLWLRPVLEAVEIRHFRVEQLLGDWNDLFLARSRRCRGHVIRRLARRGRHGRRLRHRGRGAQRRGAEGSPGTPKTQGKYIDRCPRSSASWA